MRRACAAHPLNNVSVTQYAAGIGRLSGRFEVIGSEGGAYLAPCTARNAGAGCTESFRLDDVYSWAGTHITVMKIDVEGWEISALRGAVQLLNHGAVGALLVEVAPIRCLPRSQVSLSLGSAILAELAYSYAAVLISDALLGGHCPPELSARLEAAIGSSLPSTRKRNLTHQRCAMPTCDFEQSVFTTIKPHELEPLMRRMLEATNRTGVEMSCNFWFTAP